MNWKRGSALLLAGTMLLGSGTTVCAEEVEPAGYHVYEVTETEATDTWYGTGKGAYLKAGISKILEDDASHVRGSGHTLAHKDYDRVYVRIYLDESETGTGSWTTLDYWTGEEFNASMAHVSSGPYRINKGNYYRVTGVHSVTQGETTETTGTCTDALKF